MNKRHKVLIMRCSEYDPGRIAGIIREGMQELDVKPAGKVLLKPNAVIAHPEIFPHAFTRSEFLDGVITAVREHGDSINELSVGERSGITIPTRFCFKNAGYNTVLKKHKVKTHYFDEVRQVPVRLRQADRLRDEIFIPKPVAECDFLINLPKFKAHPWTRLTLSLKNYIGIQDDRHRLVDHNCFLEQKIADLQEAVESRFIAVDGIIAGQKMMLTPSPFPLGAVILGVNSCAVDTVGCRIVNVDPLDLLHLRLASERGYGPHQLDDIEISGDFPLEELQHNTKEFEFCLEHIDTYFNGDSNLSCTVGTFPEEHSSDYCWGGCPGALQEAMHIFKGYHPDVHKTMKKVRYVVGSVEGSLDLDAGERVIFAGDCTSWQGDINGETVSIRSRYRLKHEVDVRHTRSNDMILKILGSLLCCFRNRSSRHIHAKGCPVSVAEHINYLSSVGGISNVNFDLRNFLLINISYWTMRINRFLNRIFR